MTAEDPAPRELRLTVLGPLTATLGGRPRRLGPLKQRLVLATLLCHANSPVTVDRLTEAVWEDEPPRTARKNLQVYVSALRRLLGGRAEERLVCQDSGYLLRVATEELDALRFSALSRQGKAAITRGEHALAARLFGQALALWQGEPLAGLRCSPVVRASVERLDADRAGAYEDWAEAELVLGNAERVADGLDAVAERHPMRERLQAARMTALHHAGRTAEALAVYDVVRQRLARELGLPPGSRLEALHRSLIGDVGTAALPSARAASAGCLLPPDLADFTGRTGRLRELTEAMEQGRDVLLVGVAGAGKTALAVHAAHQLGERFPDGRLMVGLRTEAGNPRPPADVLGEIARLMGCGTPDSDDPAWTAALCRSWLSGHRALLVLDDATDEATVRMLLPGGGPSRILVTSRAQLAGLAGIRRVVVPPFTVARALDLLARIIGADRLGRDPAAARRIVVAGGMLPLAVRVSGARLAMLRHLPLHEYAQRLVDPATALGELATGDVAVRPRLEASWRDLSDESRNSLLRLARLPVGAPFTLQESATALGCGVREALRRLERLIEAGAVSSPKEEVSADSARYTVPRLLQSYVRERGDGHRPADPRVMSGAWQAP